MVREDYLAVQILIGADLRRYEKLIEDTENLFTAGNENTYPTTVNNSYEMLINNNTATHAATAWRQPSQNPSFFYTSQI